MKGAAFLGCLAAAALLAPAASAHVTMTAAEPTVSARTVYTVRMPNERKVNTLRLDLFFPEGFAAGSFRQAPGWALSVERAADGRIVAAHWTGALAPDEFAEFAVAGRNPQQPGPVTFRAVQTYAGGEVIEWAGEPGSKAPAPRVVIVAAADQSADHAAHH